jgi:hypothetical protein
MKRLILSLLALGLLVPFALCGADDTPPILEAGLGQKARSILTTLKGKGIRNVAVLKFLLGREGQEKFSDSLGTLNLLLARRLEVALIVKNFPAEGETIGIVEDASTVAAGIPGASHLSKEGLDKLFAAKYPLAWGKERVQPDAFIVGNGMISKDLKTLTIALHVIDAKTRKIEPVGEPFVVRLRPEHLSETGDSFTRGAFDGGQPQLTPEKAEVKLMQEADKVRKGEQKHPLQDAQKSPFKLEVLYDGVIQPVDFKDGQARIAEPDEKVKDVRVRYTRLDTSDRTFGLVLKVNGENTLFREKLPEIQSRAWLSFAADKGKFREVRGFQVTNEKVDGFRVASRAESKAREVYYGADVGTITMTVFAQHQGKKPATPADFDAKDEMLIRKTDLPRDDDKRSTFGKLQQALYSGLDRGLIVEGGEQLPGKINVIPFERDVVPVMSVTLHYYRK